MQRADFDREKKELIKLNTRFDFHNDIYLDRFLLKNKDESLRRRAILAKYRAEKKDLEHKIAFYENFKNKGVDLAKALESALPA